MRCYELELTVCAADPPTIRERSLGRTSRAVYRPLYRRIHYSLGDHEALGHEPGRAMGLPVHPGVGGECE